MSNVVSINRGMVFGSYTDTQNSERIPEELSFAVGVISTIVLPQLGLYSVYGVLPLLVFAMVTLAGVMWGKARYNSTENVIPRIITGAVSRTSPSRESKRRGMTG